MKWNDLLEENVSQEHKNQVTDAVTSALEQQRQENYVPFWQRWNLLPNLTFAAFGALAFLFFKNNDNVKMFEGGSDGDLHLLLSLGEEVSVDELELIVDMEFFEQLEVLEKWDG